MRPGVCSLLSPRLLFLCLLLGAVPAWQPAMAQVHETDPGTENAIRDQALRLLNAGEFETLEKLATSYRRERQRTTTGAWNLSLFYRAFDFLPVDDFTLDDHGLPTAAFKAWSAAFPRSPVPYVAAARAMVRANAMLRPKGDGTPADAIRAKGYEQGMTRVRTLLERYKPVAATDPEWYVAMLELMAYKAAPITESSSMLAEAIEAHAGYYPIFYAGVFAALHAQGGADHAAVDRIARAAMDRTQATDGKSLYARVYWFAQVAFYRSNLFAKSKIDWSLMRLAAKDLLDRHSDDRNFNAMAQMACMAGDNQEAQRLMAMTKGDPDRSIWRDPKLLDRCGIKERMPDEPAVRMPVPQVVLDGARRDAWVEYAAIGAEVLKLFEASDFDALTAMAREFRETRARLHGGDWKLAAFYRAFGAVDVVKLGFDVGKPQVPAKFRAWIDRHPGSPAPYLAVARAIGVHANSIRGTTYSAYVPPSAWATFQSTSKFVAEFLKKNQSVAATDPEWYAHLIEISVSTGIDTARRAHLFNEGIKKEPDYYGIYQALGRGLLPKWGGTYAKLEALASAAAKSANDETLYARIYWSAAYFDGGTNFLRQSNADWKRIKAGFDQLIQRHGDQRAVAGAAKFACMANDAVETQRLFAWMVNGAHPSLWPTHDFLVYCEYLGQPARDVTVMRKRVPPVESTEDQREFDSMNVQLHLINRDFSKLETIADALRAGDSRTPSGTSKLALFYAQFRTLSAEADPRFDAGWLASTLKSWRVAFPKSPTPILADARARHQAAVNLLGARDNPDSRAAAVALLSGVASDLAKYQSIAERDAEWHVVALDTLEALKVDPPSYIVVLADAIAKHPGYSSIYLSLTKYVSERAGYDAAKVDAIARFAARKNQVTDGTMSYPRIFLALSRALGWWTLLETNIDWPAMKRGIRENLRDRPSDWIANEYALVSCVMGDGPETRFLLEAARGNIIASVWRSRVLLQYCQDLAAKSAPTSSPASGNAG